MNKISSQKKWSELSTQTKGRLAVTTVLQVSLLLAALLDIRKRPAEQINGQKKYWLPFLFVNFIGPITYFWRGVKR